MKTDELIETLARDARPVRRLPRPGRRLMIWVCQASALVAAGSVFFGIRPDFPTEVGSFLFLLQFAAAFLLCVFSAKSAIDLSVPGVGRTSSTFVLPFAALLLWLFCILFPLTSGPALGHSMAEELASGHSCAWRTFQLGIIPGAIAFWQLMRAAPLKRKWTGFFAALSVFSFAAIGVQCGCANDDPYHVLFWHFTPILVLGMLGALAGSRVFFGKRGTY